MHSMRMFALCLFVFTFLSIALRVEAVQVLFARGGVDIPGYTLFQRSRTTPNGPDLIKTSLTPLAYRDHIRHRTGLKYAQPLPNGRYNVRLGFMEVGGDGCQIGARVFTATVNGKTSAPIDVFRAVGCVKPYDVTLNDVDVTNGQLTIVLSKISGFSPFISNFATTPAGSSSTTTPPTTTIATTTSVVTTTAVTTTTTTSTTMTATTSPTTTEPSTTIPTTTSTTTTTTTTSTTPGSVNIAINVGPDGAVPGTTKSAFYGGPLSSSTNLPESVFRTSRYGKNFTFSFQVPPGAYDVSIGVVEVYGKICSGSGQRVFNVFVNGRLQLEGISILEFAKSCFTPHLIQIESVTVGAVDIQPLTVRFEAVSNFAQIAYLRVVSSKSTQCVPESTTGTVTDDHAAHAVPGIYPPQDDSSSASSYVDLDSNGFHNVQIDGSLSHSHFVDTRKSIAGRIVKYEWSIVETGQIISTRSKFKYQFPLGTTRLKLSVVDNSCATDEAETTVTVTNKLQPGMYCYYYPGMTVPLFGGTLSDSPRPEYGHVSNSLNLQFSNLPFSSSTFVTRCMFFYEWTGPTEYVLLHVDTAGSGQALVYKGTDLVYDSDFNPRVYTILSTGLTAFEVIYVHDEPATPPKMAFNINSQVPPASAVKHDQSTVLPILSSINPNIGPVTGGTQIKVAGYGLYQGVKVSFDSKSAPIMSFGRSSTQFSVKSPAFGSAGVVGVSVTSAGGLNSNTLSFTYGGTTCENVAFEQTKLTSSAGGNVDYMGVSTVVTLGPDRRLYVGNAIGEVHVVGYDSFTLKATTHCKSPKITDSNFKTDSGDFSDRIVLGIAFNPQHAETLPYVSMSTLFWYAKSRISRSNPAGWRNGAVERLKVSSDPGSFAIGSKGGTCLQYDKRIVSNLPVSNRDHSVNALLFNQNGDLFIAVGGSTNMGLPGSKLGNLWETPLSASILIARTSKSNFDGNIQYSNADVHFLARKVSGDVDVYASGLRNPFALTMARNGALYGSDQGPNCKYGDPSTSCSEFDVTRASNWPLTSMNNWGGRVPSQNGQCPDGISRKDKIFYLLPGHIYGHPNLARDIPGECAWIDPLSDRTVDGNAAPSNYEPPMALVRSSITGVNEYRADHFCGKLRGDLILSTYQGRTTWRLSVNLGKVVSGPDVVSNTGGIQFTEDEHGLLLFPRYVSKTVSVFKPKVAAPVALKVVGVHPWRVRVQGGVILYIGGYNFVSGASVMVGNNPCAVRSVSSRSIECTAPPSGGSVLVDVTVFAGGQQSTLSEAIRYMSS